MYAFMANAFYLLVGVLCLCLAVVIINGFAVAAIRAIRKERKRRNGNDPH